MLAKFVGKSGLVLVGITLGLCLVDVALRLRIAFDPRYQTMYDTAAVARSIHVAAHPFVPFAGRPHETLERTDTSLETRVSTNAFGYRTREFDFSSPLDSFTVVVLGGSATFAAGVPHDEDTWPALLEQRLAATTPRSRVVNLATAGATTTRLVVEMSLFGVHLAPDIVLVEIGCDELAALGAADFRPDHSHLVRDIDRRAGNRFVQERVPPAWLRMEWLRSLTGAVDRGLGVFQLYLDPRRNPSPAEDALVGIDFTFDNLRAIRELAHAKKAEPFFVILFDPRDETARHAALRTRLGTFLFENGIRGLQVPVVGFDATESKLDCTLSPVGQRIVADSVFESLQGLR